MFCVFFNSLLSRLLALEGILPVKQAQLLVYRREVVFQGIGRAEKILAGHCKKFSGIFGGIGIDG